MRSRVSKNAELYSQIASDTESKVESNDLSHFANRLNAIDQQFGKMTSNPTQDNPNHARNLEEKVLKQDLSEAVLEDTHVEASVIEPVEVPQNESLSFQTHDEFDTFESTYLNDFLQEVKAYNVKKGYRDVENTTTNILRDLNLDIEEHKSREVPDYLQEGPFVPSGIDDLLTEIDPDLQAMDTLDYLKPVQPATLEETYEEVSEPEEEQLTKHFTAVDHLQRFDTDAAHNEETIAIEVQRMVEDEYEGEVIAESFTEAQEEALMDSLESVLGDESELKDTDSESEILNETVTDEPMTLELKEENRVENFETQDLETVAVDHEVTRQLLEQTQTLSIKVIDQEKNIEEMTDTMVKTNRLLNVTLSLLMLAIFVVIMLIVSNIWR